MLSLRTALRSKALRAPPLRTLSAPVARRYASTDPDPATPDFQTLSANLKASPIFQAIKGNENAMKAVQNIGELLKSKGFQTDKPPSKWEMLKLATDKDFREASMTVSPMKLGTSIARTRRLTNIRACCDSS